MNYDLSEIWLNSSNCMTNCLRKSKTKTTNIESCYIKYELYEPVYELNETNYTQIGIFRDKDHHYYRYTSAYFFDSDFIDMLKEAEEIEITFKLIKDGYYYWGSEIEDAFKDNIFLKGHGFYSYESMIEDWKYNGINEFKYHKGCPFYCSGYEELKAAMTSDKDTITFKLNTALIKEFEAQNVKGLQLYCHDTVSGAIKIENTCTVKVTKFKNPFEPNIISKEAVMVKNKKIYNEDVPYLHAGAVNYYGFFMFDNDFENMLKIADEIELSFNLLWFLPEGKSPIINVNNNYIGKHILKDAFILTGHSFSNLEELSLCKTKEEFFESKDFLHSVGAYTSFKKALENGHTTFTITLNKESIETFKVQNIKGFRVGLNENGTGYWRMSKICSAKITKFNESYKPIYNATSSGSWINLNKPTFVGKQDNCDIEYTAFYFFDNGIKSAMDNREIEHVSIRFYFDYEYTNYDDGFNVSYQICCHNFAEIEDALEVDYVKRRNTLCTFKTREHYPEYIDIILSREQINMIKESEGLCVYSKHKNTFTVHQNKISLFIDYEIPGEKLFEREFNALKTKTFILEDRKTYKDEFICGSDREGHLYRPFAYLGDNFFDFLNKEKIIDIKIIVKLSANYLNEDRYSYNYLSNIEFYTHNISFNEANYNAYIYKEPLFKIDTEARTYFEIDLTEKQIEILTNSFGLGAFIDDNIYNRFVVIEDFSIIVTYTR